VGGLTGAIGAKAAATAATAALLTAGAVEVKHIYSTTPDSAPRIAEVQSPATHHSVTAAGPKIKVDVPAATVTVTPGPAEQSTPANTPTEAVHAPADPVGTVTDQVPADTAPAADTAPDDDELVDDGTPPAETYTPATAVVGPAAGGSGATNEDEDGQLVVQPSGSGPSEPSPPTGVDATPQPPSSTPPPATTPPALTPGPSAPVAPGSNTADPAPEPVADPSE
jgi:hypothetical protein